MKNIVELIEHDIIYVEKAGDQTPQSMLDLFMEISKRAVELRVVHKPVLILSNGQKEAKMDPQTRKIAAAIGKDLNYDKSATYGSPAHIHAMREHMISEAKLDQKVANFQTRQEAIDWLLQ